MSELILSIITHIRKEIEKTEWKHKFLEPVIKGTFSIIWPYVIGIICLNFFMTIAAVSLVLYVFTKNTRLSNKNINLSLES
jgi:hypothetical protein